MYELIKSNIPLIILDMSETIIIKKPISDEKIEKRIRSVAENLIGYIHDHICPRFALESMVRETTEA